MMNPLCWLGAVALVPAMRAPRTGHVLVAGVCSRTHARCLAQGDRVRVIKDVLVRGESVRAPRAS